MGKDADFNVLMLGPRRVGKSSVLSAMLKSFEMLEQKTGLCFQADEGTKIVMREKLSDLEQLFVLHAANPEEPFSTLLGQENGIEYSPFTSGVIPYRFNFFLVDKKGKRKKTLTYSIEFTDIAGEYMTNDLEMAGSTIVDRYMKSQLVVIAIDSPALMEGKIKNDVGEFHPLINVPDSAYHIISNADCKIKEKLKNKKAAPRMVLFVPLKCEKYYHEGRMEELSEKVKIGYSNVLAYLKGCEEYIVAITPILTLGDIVFDHYGTRTDQDGNQRVAMMERGREDGLFAMPELPMYRLRNASCTTINPLYCEQPLMYLCKYVLKTAGKQKSFTLSEQVIDASKKAMWIYLFGIYYLMFAGGKKLLKDRDMKKYMENLCGHIKTSGDGYELIQDNLNIIGKDV